METNDAAAINKWINLLETSKHWEERREAILRLKTYKGDQRINQVLRKRMFYDPDVLVRIEAISTLGKIGRVEDVSPLLSLLNDKNIAIKLAAEAALASLPFALVKSTLLRVLKKSTSPIQIRVALKILHDHKDSLVFELAERILQRCSEGVVIIQALKVLGDAPRLNNYDALIKLLYRHSASPSVLLACIEVLRRFHVHQAEESLIHLLITNQEEQVQIKACQALAELGSEKSLSVLETLIDTAPSKELSKAASEAYTTLAANLQRNITDNLEDEVRKLLQW